MKWLLSAILLSCACGDTGRERVSVAAFAQGTAARPVAIADATVLLTRADLAFGPLYFCASQIGRAQLCDVAIAELLTVQVLPTLGPTRRPIGTLAATTGSIMSAIYDLGISWLLTENEPTPSADAPSGHSAIFEGTLTRAGKTLHFSVSIDAAPRVRGDLTLNAQRTSHELTGDDETVTLHADPNSWVDRLDVDALFALDGDGDGNVTIPSDSTSYESIYQGMLNRSPMTFGWDE